MLRAQTQCLVSIRFHPMPKFCQMLLYHFGKIRIYVFGFHFVKTFSQIFVETAQIVSHVLKNQLYTLTFKRCNCCNSIYIFIHSIDVEAHVNLPYTIKLDAVIYSNQPVYIYIHIYIISGAYPGFKQDWERVGAIASELFKLTALKGVWDSSKLLT